MNRLTLDIKKRFFAEIVLLMVAALLLATLLAHSVGATHSWGAYHWARQSTSFTLKLSSNLSADWRPYLLQTSSDWSASSVLDTTVITGSKNPKTCKPSLGKVEVCNSKYGANGWLGIAQIWINGSHITQGAVKLNDTYMSRPLYNTVSEKNHVMCQEVGHTFGLGHQDESGRALGTCMDYSMDTGSQHPNAHDYEQLEFIYAHLDSTTTVDISSTSAATSDTKDTTNKQNWGRRVFRSKDGFVEVYEKVFVDGSKLLTSVTLAKH